MFDVSKNCVSSGYDNLSRLCLLSSFGSLCHKYLCLPASREVNFP